MRLTIIAKGETTAQRRGTAQAISGSQASRRNLFPEGKGQPTTGLRATLQNQRYWP